jgi:cyanophycin synthetase
VTLNITGREGIPEAVKLAMEYSSAAIVEKHITGLDYRVLVVGDKVSAVARRLPPHVVGDGLSTVRQLVDKENENPMRGEDHEKALTKIELDETALHTLAEANLEPDTVPAKDAVVYLRKNANLSTGGTAISCPDGIHPHNARLAVRAAKALGLDIAGVDICSPDLSVPLMENGGAVLEVNAGPGLRMHLIPSEGPPAPVAKDILDLLFPPGMPYTIPICAVTGTNGKTTVTRLIAHTLSLGGLKVGMTTTSGVYLGDECLLPGDNTGAERRRGVIPPRRRRGRTGNSQRRHREARAWV